jgi:hypothetical protein
MIVKTFFGTHIDLSKVVAISDVFQDHEYHTCGIAFAITVQLRDAPIIYSELCPCENFKPHPEAIAALQEKVDGLIEQWRQTDRWWHLLCARC